MKQTSVFVTYNPGNEFEQTLAVRLHTIGAVHGFTMLMPDRFNGTGKLNGETIHRIKSADYFIFFSTSPLTSIVQQEINTAFTHLKDKSKILIIYNKVKNLKHSQNCTEVFIDAKKESSQEILAKAIAKIKENQRGTSAQKAVKQDDSVSVLGGILLIGLGLITLDAVFNSPKK